MPTLSPTVDEASLQCPKSAPPQFLERKVTLASRRGKAIAKVLVRR
jgi:hypothetical protein